MKLWVSPTLPTPILPTPISPPNGQIVLFRLQTDYRALVGLDRLKENNAQLTHWSLSLQPYVYSVCHRTGKANGNADGGRSVRDYQSPILATYTYVLELEHW